MQMSSFLKQFEKESTSFDKGRKYKLEVFLIYFLHLTGVFWFTTGLLGSTIYILSGPFILISGIYAVYKLYLRSRELRKRVYSLLMSLMVVAISGLVFEYIGWTTGFPYGQFWYTDVLQPQILGTPLAIGAAWMYVTVTSIAIVIGLFKSLNRLDSLKIGLLVFLSGVIAAFFDWIMEPTAVSLGFWYWGNTIPPLKNYISWFVISSIMAFIMLKIHGLKSFDIDELRHLYLSQTIFFLLLSIL
ncbi:MAG: hypothetical protein Kapaf2KO_07560 [Candidatus Kapaibacteriales bacterium]